MTPKQFVEAVRETVMRSAVKTVAAILAKPPRGSGRAIAEASAWYNDLSVDARKHLRVITQLTAHDAVFGMFAVLDGVRAIESTRDKGELRLTFVKQGTETVLNPPRGEMLHDLLNDAPFDHDS